MLRKATLPDAGRLQQLGRHTFFETFAASNSDQNMRTYPEEGFAIEKLTTELQEPYSAFYFAQQAGRVIGYLKANNGAAQTEQHAQHALEIERLYVLQEFYGQQVGQLLYAAF